MSELFVSWAGSYAHKVGKLIRDLFAPFSDRYSVFLSSIDLPRGLWRTHLLDSLHSANAGVVIFSQDGIKSDWQLHESAVLSTRPDNLNIFLFEAPPAMLPLPLRDFQWTLLDRQTMEVWVNGIIRDRGLYVDGKRKQEFLDDVDNVVKSYRHTHVTGAAERWKDLSYPLAISTQGNSPYEISEIIRVAQERIVLVAQNHRFMTDPSGAADACRDQLFTKIKEGVIVDIIAMHPDCPPAGADDFNACRVWGFSSGSSYFDDHLKDCWRTLIGWNEKYKRETGSSLKGRLRIMGAYLLPMSINVIDPDSANGFAVLSPRLTEQNSKSPRPQFIVTQRYERAVFRFYWEAINNSFDNAGWKTVDQLPAYV
jgi:hypothetical protein